MKPASVPRMVSVGEIWGLPAGASFASALAKPKSSTFTRPSGVILMFAGFRSRCTMPFSCAYSMASAICEAIGSASVERDRSGGDPLRQRGAFDQFDNQRPLLDAVDRSDVGVIQRGQNLGFAREARQSIGILRERIRDHLDRDLAE